MPQIFRDLDVRPILAAGGEPFGAIMQAVAALPPGAGLRLVAPFRPAPLFAVMAEKGFAHEARPMAGSDWEVLFTRAGAEAPEPDAAPEASDGGDWPAPAMVQDNRLLEQPEPMLRILAALEAMAPGAVLEARLPREPLFLLPELRARGHAWRGDWEAGGGSYRIRVRKAGAA